MADIDQLPPTRTVLLQLRSDLREAEQGYGLLERKREVLLQELWGLLRQVEQSEKDVRKRFEEAYRALRRARLALGSERVLWSALAPAAYTHYAIELRNVMGVALPQLHLRIEPLPLPYSGWGTSTTLDEARERWLEVGEILGTWTEVVGAVWRLAAELERTQRRVNALKHVLIPRYERAIQRIEAVLEEQERESFMQAKRVKRKRGDEGE